MDTSGKHKGLLVGYARVSTEKQNLELQIQNLRHAGVDDRHLYVEVESGANRDRPILKAAIEFLREGDLLVVWKLDRLCRSLHHLLETVDLLKKRGVQLRSLQEEINTTTPGGQLVFHIFGALAQFERELIRERVVAGLEVARRAGRIGGRPKVLCQEKKKLLKDLLADGKQVTTIAKLLGVSRSVVHREKALITML